MSKSVESSLIMLMISVCTGDEQKREQDIIRNWMPYIDIYKHFIHNKRYKTNKGGILWNEVII